MFMFNVYYSTLFVGDIKHKSEIHGIMRLMDQEGHITTHFLVVLFDDSVPRPFLGNYRMDEWMNDGPWEEIGVGSIVRSVGGVWWCLR